MRPALAASVLCLALLASPVRGSEGVEADRPDLAEGPTALPAGTAKLEKSGFGELSLGFERDLPSPHPRVAAGLIAEVSLPASDPLLGLGVARRW